MISLAHTHTCACPATSATEKPYLVFLHGLDSTRFTWKDCIAQLETSHNIVALDLRGHGESSFGAEEDFSASMLVEDIRHTLQEVNVPAPFVLIGHSMGGRVAMAFGATYPQDVATLVIEDMDIRLRAMPLCSSTDLEDRRALSACRLFSSFAALEDSLLRWYEMDRIRRWQKDGRVFEVPPSKEEQDQESVEEVGNAYTSTCSNPPNVSSSYLSLKESSSSWWCGVNPLAQYHARKSVLATVGEREWVACGGGEGDKVGGQYPFPIHVLVAGDMSACSAASVSEMKSLVPRAQIHTFPQAEHSIHRTDFEHFIATISTAIYPEAQQYCIDQSFAMK